MSLIQFPEVDYRNHPGFVNLQAAHRSQIDEIAVQQQIAEINLGYSKVQQLGLTNSNELCAVFARTTAAPAKSLIDQLQAELGDARLANWMRDSFEKTLELMQYNALTRQCGIRTFELQSEALKTQWQSLRCDGFARFDMHADLRDELFRLALPFRTELQRRADKNPAGRLSMQMPLGSRVVRRLNGYLHSSGMVALTEADRGKRVEIDHLSLHYSHSKQTWFQGCYSDIDMPTTKLAYLHYDKDPTALKVLAYLNPVNEGAGAFGFVKGSVHWQRSEFGFALRNFLAPIFERHFQTRNAGEYYRPSFSDTEARRWMLCLPSALHGSSHFGDDIMDGSAMHQQIAAALKPITGDTGCVLFDGGRGLHIGGITHSEPRWAIQLGLRPRKARDAMQKLKHWGRYARAWLKGL